MTDSSPLAPGWGARSGPQRGEPAPRERVWTPGRPVDVLGTLAPLVRGPGDPAHRVDEAGRFWWACATPPGGGGAPGDPAVAPAPGGAAAGVGTLALRSAGTAVHATAWGPGAGWLLDRVPALLGAGDDWSGLDVSGVPLLRRTRRAHPGVRLPATGLVLDSLVPAILEQKVTNTEAWRAWRGLCRRFGHPAPGPRPDLFVPPGPSELLDIPTWDWHRLGVDGKRSRAIRAVAAVARRMEECLGLEPDAAATRLRVVPGVGEWTAAETLLRAAGHPDAVSAGDFHLADAVVHALTGRVRGTDAEMLELLAPWSGQRARVIRLIELSGVRPPKFGPRLAPRDIRAL